MFYSENLKKNKDIKHGFFSRKNGVSKGIYESLNCGVGSNDKKEKGSCILEFPGKLKCEYFDNKQKELVINNKRLAISQKRYNKTYYYPISSSPFLNILYKDKLLDIINSGTFEVGDQNLKLKRIKQL